MEELTDEDVLFLAAASIMAGVSATVPSTKACSVAKHRAIMLFKEVYGREPYIGAKE